MKYEKTSIEEIHVKINNKQNVEIKFSNKIKYNIK